MSDCPPAMVRPGTGAPVLVGAQHPRVAHAAGDAAPALEHLGRRGRARTNLTANAVFFAVQGLITALLTPYLIAHLGWSAYGLIPLTTVLVSYAGIVTVGLSTPVSRFVTVAMEQGDRRRAAQFFSTSLIASCGVAVLLAPVGLLAAMHADSLMRVPIGHERQAQWLLLGALTMFLGTALSAPFDVATFYRNRFDAKNAAQLVAHLAGRVGVVVLCFEVLGATLQAVAAGLALTGVLLLAGSLVNWQRLLPDLRARLRDFEWRALGEMLSTGSWVVVTQVGTLLLLSTDLLVVNRLLGPEEGGRYGSVAQWSACLRGFAGITSTTFVPTITALYGRGDIAALASYARRAVRFLSLLLAAPVGILAGLAHPFLVVWLGPNGTASLAPLLVLMVLPLAANLGYMPLHGVCLAANRVRLPGLVQLAVGAINLALAVLLGRSFGMLGVAAAGVIALGVRNLAFTPLYAAAVARLPWWAFVRDALPIAALSVVPAAGGYLLSSALSLSSLPRLLCASGALLLVYGVCAWRLFLSSEDRAALRAALPRPLAALGQPRAECE